jgi:ElaB/YqjD/DUF883 family membrane-anchored ribosome-binding protein
MAWQPSRSARGADIERLLQDVEERLSRLSRIAGRASAVAPRRADRIAETVTAALTDIADRFRGGARAVGSDAAHLGDDAFKFGHDALKMLTREVEQRPLVTLAVAVGVGALAAGLLARRG